jgi:hypothetical protein
MKIGVLIIYSFACLSLLLPPNVVAQEAKIHFGNLKIIPGLSVQGVYDDNIYLGSGTNSEAELKESDWINHLLPEVNLHYNLKERGNFIFLYEGDLAYYSGNSSNNWQTHRGTFNLNYLAPVGLSFDLNSTYTDAEDPYGSVELYRIGLKTERWHNDLKATIGYDFGNIFKALIFFNQYKQDYALERDYTQDYDENELGLGFQRRLLPKTWGFFRYQFGERDYFTHPAGTGVTGSNDSDFDWHMVYFGLTWDTGAKLNGELNLGYEWRDYQNATDVQGNRYDDKATWVSSTQVSFQATSTTALALGITKALRERYSNTNEYFEDTGIGINVQKVIQRKFTLTVGGVYSINEYNTPSSNPRQDDNYKFSIGIDHQIQVWLTTGVGYIHERNDSNYEENNYTNNQLLISLSAWY